MRDEMLRGVISIACLSLLAHKTLCQVDCNRTDAIRLSSQVQGTSSLEGVLEVFHGGAWGTVCRDFFQYSKAQGIVACAELGFAGFDDYVYHPDAEILYGSFSNTSAVADFICNGNEDSLFSCNVRPPPSNCKTAALKCTDVPFNLRVESGKGIVQVVQNGVVRGLVCDSITDAALNDVCVEAGYPEGLEKHLRKGSELNKSASEYINFLGCKQVCNRSNSHSLYCYNHKDCNYTAIKCHGSELYTTVVTRTTLESTPTTPTTKKPIILSTTPTTKSADPPEVLPTTLPEKPIIFSNPAIIGITVSVLVVLAVLSAVVTLFLCYFCCCKSGKKEKFMSQHVQIDLEDLPPALHKRNISAQQKILRRSPMHRVDGDWEIEYSSLKLQEKLGIGAFGIVYRAVISDDPYILGSTTVAVKLLKDDAPNSEKIELLNEIELMKDLNEHSNVVQLLGCCTKGSNIALVMHYFPNGNLKDFLIKHRPISTGEEDSAQNVLKMLDLLSFARQVARGMQFLAAYKIVHRDLAARNVLVDKDLKLRVADFGLSRDIYTDLQYTTTKGSKLPVRWMAIEALVDRTFTSSSDVWSYGIVLWEIITYGWHPYPEIGNHEIVKKLEEGYRMPQPRDCPEDLYELMLMCWKEYPMDRPSFSQTLRLLDAIISQDSEAKDYLEVTMDDHSVESLCGSGVAVMPSNSGQECSELNVQSQETESQDTDNSIQ